MVLRTGSVAAVERYLDAVDEVAPGLIVGMHAVGSLALGDYHPDRSDIDVVAVVAETPDAAARSLLCEVHRTIAGRVEGPYVPAAALAQRPEDVGPVAYHVEDRFEYGLCPVVNPVTWSILAEQAVTLRGPRPAELGVRADHDAVKTYSAAQLKGYWAGWARTITGLLDGAHDDDPMEARLLELGVLGAARTHCAAHTGRVVSKRAGGDYALETFAPEWHEIVHVAIAARDQELREVSIGDLRRACAFVAEAAASV